MIDAVDVLVVEDTAEVLHEVRLERRDVGEALVVDALGLEVEVDVGERLDLDVLQLGEAALEGVALATDADAGSHELVVGALDARRALRRRRKEVAASGHHRGGHAEPGRKLAPRQPIA